MSSNWSDRLDQLQEFLYEFFGRGPIRRAVRAIFINLSRHDGLQLASAMAFDLFLALIPLLALGGWVVSSVLQGDHEAMDNLSLWLDLAPTDVRNVINSHADRFFGGAMAPVAFGGALWLASGAFYTVMAAFERTLPADPRPWWTRRGIAILCVLFMLASLSLGAWVSVQLVGGREFILGVLPELLVDNSPIAVGEFGDAQQVGLLVSTTTMMLLIAGFFRIGVRRDVAKRYVWPGTLLTVALGSAASYAFSLYARTLARYAVYYGSLAAVAIVLAWLWMCSMSLLLGAELNVYLEENRRKR